MKKMLVIIMVLVSYLNAMAQTIGEFKPKDQSYGLNKLKNAKRIYIAGFDVNYQVYNEKQSYKQGGAMLGGGQKGESLTEVSVGLEGLDEKTLQEITDKLFQDYKSKLEAKGLTIISADEAAKAEHYADYERVKGGKISTAELPGVMTNSPTGFEYFVKGFAKDGKEKKGGFLGNEASQFAKLSKDLDDAIIGNVDITVLFIQDQEAFQGSGAKIKVKTNLRVIATEAIVSTLDAKIKFKGQNEVTTVVSSVAFYHGKVGAGATSVYNGTMGKPLLINNVIEEQKITSFARGSMSSGTPTIYGTYYGDLSAKTKNAKVIEVDPAKYKEGVYMAANKFLAHHTDAFLKEL